MFVSSPTDHPDEMVALRAMQLARRFHAVEIVATDLLGIACGPR
jgi:hypothetical protein